MAETEIGKVTHYFGHINVAGVKLSGDLSVRDTVRSIGHTTNHTQKIESIQVEHDQLARAMSGAEIGLKVTEHVREHDTVYLVD